jgi:hypothetical protein
MAADVRRANSGIARTDAEAASVDQRPTMKTANPSSRASVFRKASQTNKGIDQAISRAIAYAHYADFQESETGTPDLSLLRICRCCAQCIRKYTSQPPPLQLEENLTMRPLPNSNANWAPWLQVSVHHLGWHSLDVVQHV